MDGDFPFPGFCARLAAFVCAQAKASNRQVLSGANRTSGFPSPIASYWLESVELHEIPVLLTSSTPPMRAVDISLVVALSGSMRSSSMKPSSACCDGRMLHSAPTISRPPGDGTRQLAGQRVRERNKNKQSTPRIDRLVRRRAARLGQAARFRAARAHESSKAAYEMRYSGLLISRSGKVSALKPMMCATALSCFH